MIRHTPEIRAKLASALGTTVEELFDEPEPDPDTESDSTDDKCH